MFIYPTLTMIVPWAMDHRPFFQYPHLGLGYLKWRRSSFLASGFPLASPLSYCLLCACEQHIHQH